MILLKAYTEVNFGDDLIIDMVTERYPDTKFIMIAPKVYKKIFKSRKNLIIINRRGIFCRIAVKIIKKFKLNLSVERIINIFCSGSVYAGGSIFMENKEKHLKSIKDFLNSINGKFSAVIGCNFGPYGSESFLEDYRNAFKNITDICFRDKKSFDLFADLPNVRCASDIVFGLKSDGNDEEKKQIFISVIDLGMRSELAPFREEYIKAVVKIINRFNSLGYKAVVASFCEYEGDEKTVAAVLNSPSLKNGHMVSELMYRGDIKGVLDCIKESEYILGTRFHSVIAGIVFKKKVLPVLYSGKTSSALESCNMRFDYIDIKSMDGDFSNIERRFKKCGSELAAGAALNAEKQFEVVDSFLSAAQNRT